MFHPLNELLRGEPYFIRLHVNGALQALEDWKQVIQKSAKRPTHMCELIGDEPDYVGNMDVLVGSAVGG